MKSSHHRVGERQSVGGQFGGRRLAVTGVTALVASVAATRIIRAIAVKIVTVPAAFTPLKTASVASLTILGVLAVCAALNRFSDRPVATFRRIAPTGPGGSRVQYRSGLPSSAGRIA